MISPLVFGQSKLNSFLKPTDSLNVARNTVAITGAALSAGVFIDLIKFGMPTIPRSDFHFINDNAEWLQMDKAGHVYSSYHLASIGKNALAWSGVSKKKPIALWFNHGICILISEC